MLGFDDAYVASNLNFLGMTNDDVSSAVCLCY